MTEVELLNLRLQAAQQLAEMNGKIAAELREKMLKQEAAIKLATDALQWIESCSSFSRQYVRSSCNKKATEALTAIKELNK